MALRNIVKKGDDVLTKMCRPVEKFDEKLCTLLDDMYETMEDANGVGLAAPQVGLLRRIVVIDVGEGRIELINPEIIKTSGEQDGAEGCLSFPGEFGMVKRPMNVTVRVFHDRGQAHEAAQDESRCRQRRTGRNCGDRRRNGCLLRRKCRAAHGNSAGKR